MPTVATSVEVIHVLFDIECARATGNATATADPGSRSLPLVSGLPASVACVEVLHVQRDGLFDIECARVWEKLQRLPVSVAGTFPLSVARCAQSYSASYSEVLHHHLTILGSSGAFSMGFGT